MVMHKSHVSCTVAINPFFINLFHAQLESIFHTPYPPPPSKPFKVP